MKKKLLLLALILVIIAAVAAFYQFNKTHPDLHSEKAEYSLTSNELAKAFTENEESATAEYSDAILAIEGEVSSIENQGDTLYTVYLLGEGLSSVACEMNSKAEADGIKEGEVVKIKGICSGYLLDVILVQCVQEQ